MYTTISFSLLHSPAIGRRKPPPPRLTLEFYGIESSCASSNSKAGGSVGPGLWFTSTPVCILSSLNAWSTSWLTTRGSGLVQRCALLREPEDGSPAPKTYPPTLIEGSKKLRRSQNLLDQ